MRLDAGFVGVGWDATLDALRPAIGWTVTKPKKT
jgi:hypothetical protein